MASATREPHAASFISSTQGRLIAWFFACAAACTPDPVALPTPDSVDTTDAPDHVAPDLASGEVAADAPSTLLVDAAPATAAPDGQGEDAPPADTSTPVDTGVAADTGPAADTSPPTDTGKPKPGPSLASGGFAVVAGALGAPLAVDSGVPGKKDPLASAGLLVDLDKDGLLDFVLSDGIDKATWGRAIAPWKWVKAPLFQAKQPGLRSLAVTDADADGFPEIVLGGAKLYYLMRKPGETYSDEAKARGLLIDGAVAVQGIMPVDLDSDGLLDLAVALFSCSPDARLHSFLNRGDGTYVEAGLALGTAHVASLWHVMATDVDGDRHQDLLAMAEGCDPKGGNAYLHNRGYLPGKRFERLGLWPVFPAKGNGGGTPMGGSVGDADGDGDLDYVMSEIGYREQRMGGMNMRKPDLVFLGQLQDSGNHLLLRKPDGSFASQGVQAGLALPLSATGQTMVSWSARLFDFDADGHLDVWMTHGWDYSAFLLNDVGGSRPVLFRGQGNGTFAEVSATFGVPAEHRSKALATADVDGDGDLDLLLGGQGVQPLLLRNDITHPNQWLTVRLRGTASNVWGLGARVELQTSVRTYVAEMSLQAPAQTVDQALVHFGVPKGELPIALTVRWPSGYDQTLPLAVLGQALLVTEPPLVQLSARYVQSTPDAKVTVTARAYASNGGPALPGTPVAIEFAPGQTAAGNWQGATSCEPSGQCQRVWSPPSGATGEASLVITLGGQALVVRPKLRFSPKLPGPSP